MLYTPVAVRSAFQRLSDAVTMTLVRLALITSERHALALSDPSGDPSQRLLLLREIDVYKRQLKGWQHGGFRGADRFCS